MGTVKAKISKSEKRESLKRGKSFHNHFPTKYSTLDGRSSRAGSRPTLSNFSMNSSRASLTSTSTAKTSALNSPRTATPTSLNSNVSMTIAEDEDVVDVKGSSVSSNTTSDVKPQSPQDEGPPVGLYVMPLEDGSQSPTIAQSEYANIVVLPKDEEDPLLRSLSFSGPIQKPARNRNESNSLIRTESDAIEVRRMASVSSDVPNQIDIPDTGDFASKLALIQSQLIFPV